MSGKTENMPSVYAVIPARGGSKGVKNKNLKVLADYPLITWSVKAALKSRLINRVIVSTDSGKIAAVAEDAGAEIPFMRPAEYAGDTSKDIDVLLHLISWFEQKEERLPDYIVYLRPTTPVRDPAVIDKAIEKLIESNSASSLRSVHEMPETAYKCLEMRGERLVNVFTGSEDLELTNMPRQSFPVTYQPNGYVDISKVSVVKEEGRMFGSYPIGFITPVVTEVDTYDDLQYLEFRVAGDCTEYNVIFKGE